MKNVTKLLLGCSMLITPISLMTTLASCTNTPINENSVPKNIINGSLVDNGLVSHSGTLTTPFDVNFTNGTPKQDKNVV
jgi:hypothetical protein